MRSFPHVATSGRMAEGCVVIISSCTRLAFFLHVPGDLHDVREITAEIFSVVIGR